MILILGQKKSSLCFFTTTYEVHTLKNKNEKKLLRDIFDANYKFVLIETRAYDIAHDENAMSSLIIQSL